MAKKELVNVCLRLQFPTERLGDVFDIEDEPEIPVPEEPEPWAETPIQKVVRQVKYQINIINQKNLAFFLIIHNVFLSKCFKYCIFYSMTTKKETYSYYQPLLTRRAVRIGPVLLGIIHLFCGSYRNIQGKVRDMLNFFC